MQITEINKQKTRIPIYLQIAENLRDPRGCSIAVISGCNSRRDVIACS